MDAEGGFSPKELELELNGWRERPPMPRAVDADIADPRLHAERVQKTMVVVGSAVLLVHRDVELVRALDEIQAVDGKTHFAVPAETKRLHLLDLRVRAVAADA